MEFIQLEADADGIDNNIEIEETDDTSNLGDFIDELPTTSFQGNRFYRAVDNSLYNKKNNESDDESDWVIDK